LNTTIGHNNGLALSTQFIAIMHVVSLQVSMVRGTSPGSSSPSRSGAATRTSTATSGRASLRTRCSYRTTMPSCTTRTPTPVIRMPGELTWSQSPQMWRKNWLSGMGILFAGLQIRLRIFIYKMSISSPNPMFDNLLESSHRDNSNKWSNIGFGEEITL